MTEAPDHVTLVRGGHVLTMGAAGDVRDGAVAIRDRTIVAVGPFTELASAHPDATVVGDAEGIVLPGFVNAHNHLSEALICGMGEDMTLFEWVARIIRPVGWELTQEHAYVGSLVKGAELLLTGVTTVNDMFCYTAAQNQATLGVVRAMEEVGLRGVLSFGAVDSGYGEAQGCDGDVVDLLMAEHEALAAACATSQRQMFRMGIGVVHAQSDKLFDASIGFAQQHGFGVHTHIAEVREEITEAHIRWGTNTLGRANLHGLLDCELIAAHCVWCNEHDISLMAHKHVNVAHNPVANMILASGVCPVPRMRSAGINVGIGTDGAASNDSQNMLEAIKCAALLQKVHHLDPRALLATEVLRMATIEGARALAIDHLVGSLEPGKRADVVRMRGDLPGLANVHDPYQRIVYSSSPLDVADVWVDGARRVAGGRVTSGDVHEWVAASKPLAADLVRRAGLVDHSVLAREVRGC